MAAAVEDRISTQGSRISFKEAMCHFDALRAAATPVGVTFFRKSESGGTVRIAIDGQVVSVDPEGIVTISGHGGEISVDVNPCEFSCMRENSFGQGAVRSPELHTALQLTFAGGEVCLVHPSRHGSRAPAGRRGTPRAFGWLRNRLRGSTARHQPLKSAPPEPVPELRGMRDLLVDVWHNQANIVEIVHGENGANRIRRLKEQFLPQDERMGAERLKRQIIFSENGGAYDLNGLYRPRWEPSFRELARLVRKLEEIDGSQAWDRRRYPR
jgi:hypothetical protein